MFSDACRAYVSRICTNNTSLPLSILCTAVASHSALLNTATFHLHDSPNRSLQVQATQKQRAASENTCYIYTFRHTLKVSFLIVYTFADLGRPDWDVAMKAVVAEYVSLFETFAREIADSALESEGTSKTESSSSITCGLFFRS